MGRTRAFQRNGPARALGLLLAMLAVCLPVLLGPIVHAAMMRQVDGMAMAGDMPDCHEAMGDPRPDQPPGPQHHDPDCAVCPLCAALAHPAIAWTPAPTAPTPSVTRMERPELPPGARAPPRLSASAAQPRGPPSRI